MTAPADAPAADPAGAEFPCSLGQQRFWVLERLEPGNPALNIAGRWRLRGPLDVTLLERAIDAVVARHEVLRTGLFEQDGRPMQLVMPQVPVRLAVHDLTRLPEEERTREAARIGDAEAHASFDLLGPPLWRMTLLVLAPEEAVLLVTVHHLISDGWSMGILAREIGRNYAALRETGRPAALPELPIQYGDYANWQRAWLESPALEAGRAFWRERLAGLAPLDLPLDRPRPPVQTSSGAIVSLLLPRAVSDAAAARAQAGSMTLFTLGLAALAALLHRATGATDIAIGTQIAGRDEVELEDLIGLFINTVVLRIDLSGDPTVDALIARVHASVQAALAHRQVPFEQVIEAVNPERDLSRGPLFSVNCIFQRSFIGTARYADIELAGIPSQVTGALYDLNFFMVERTDGWRASCEYNTDLFDAGTAESLLRVWQAALAALPASGGTRLSALDLQDAEGRRALAGWNATDTPCPAEPVPALLAQQAARTPDALALVAPDRSLTYGALEAEAVALAHRLRARGVGPGSLVGLCLARRADMVVALLGVLRAGAAYVPLDPAYPQPRLAQMVEDAGLALVLSDAESAGFLPAVATPPPVLLVDAPAEAAAGTEAKLPAPALDDRAYVIFTSGSTGRPKGVEIPHRALVNLLWAMRARPGLSRQDVFVAVTTLSFDIATAELLLPLLVGARLVLADRDQAADGTELARLLRGSGATAMQATPATWQMLLESGWSGRLKMLCGGEALPRALADRLLRLGGPLWNMYGPTETTIWSAAGEVVPGAGPVTVGPPLANTQLHVLTAGLAVAPVGCRGELYIGGSGVARGYLGRPDLTAERFIADPFRDLPSARLYRTGDLARRRADGRIEFLGRADDQVKLRGFRIELGEVEAALLAHPGIAAVAVDMRRDANGFDALIAWVAPDAALPAASRAELAQALRRHAAAALPAFMVPSRVVVLDALPRTPNGKTDRRALKLAAEPRAAVQPAAPPADGTVAALTAIWREVLGVGDIGPDANFFELGGHSLLALRMLAAVEGHFGERPRLSTLFRTPTIAGLAAALGPRQREAVEIEVATWQAEGAGPPIIGINDFGLFMPMAQALGTAQPFLSFCFADAEHERALPDRTLEEFATAYVEAIRRKQPDGPYTLVGWCFSGALTFEIAQRLRAQGQAVRLLVMVDTWAPGYWRKLSGPAAFLARISYRLQWYAKEWRGGQQTAWQMILGSRWARRLGGLSIGGRNLRQRAGLLPDPYRWFIEHLGAMLRRYEPARFDAPVLLLRSSDEPRGGFLDPAFGWGRLLPRLAGVSDVPGGHLSVYQSPGAEVIAARIRALLEQLSDAPATGPH